jgi:hypothetical protein
LKWSKKQKRRNKEKESKPLNKKIKEDKSSNNVDLGQLNKWKNTPRNVLESLTGKKEEQAGEALKMWVIWDLGFRHLGF